MDQKLNPCGCGGEAYIRNCIPEDLPYMFRVRCACGECGPMQNSGDEAAEAWNRAHPLQAAPQPRDVEQEAREVWDREYWAYRDRLEMIDAMKNADAALAAWRERWAK